MLVPDMARARPESIVTRGVCFARGGYYVCLTRCAYSASTYDSESHRDLDFPVHTNGEDGDA